MSKVPSALALGGDAKEVPTASGMFGEGAYFCAAFQQPKQWQANEPSP
jgi:hypothetical protein